MTRDEIAALQRRHRAFSETDLGKLYNRAIRATEAYWAVDGQEGASDRRLRELHDKMNAAQKDLSEKLMSIAGV